MRKKIIGVLGSHGTVGLELMPRLRRLAAQQPVEILSLSRHSWYRSLGGIDLLILCTPDEVSKEVAEHAVKIDGLRILDVSAAHRIHPDWVYGLPELQDVADRVKSARWVANPGCFASGAVLMAHPLRQAGLMPAEPVLFMGASGYSAGGKKMIDNPPAISLLCALGGEHRHQAEIRIMLGLEPTMMLNVGSFYRGMSVQMLIDGNREIILDAWHKAYENMPTMTISEDTPDRVSVGQAGDGVVLRAYPHAGNKVLCMAAYDNLGKGAAGAVLQNIRLMMGM